MSRWIVLALLVPATATAEPMLFQRVVQAGGLDRGDIGAAYTLDAGRAILAVEGTSDRGDAYRGVTHRLSSSYGILDWLGAGAEQSIKQPAGDEIRLGVFVPELVARLDRLGLPVEGLGTYVQGRVRVTATRRSSLAGGLVLDRRGPASFVAGRLGFESTLGGPAPELGFRAELGIAWLAGDSWLVSVEGWGNTRWRDGVAESDYHAGPSLQLRWRALRVGLQVASGVKSRPGLLVVDGVATLRVAASF